MNSFKCPLYKKCKSLTSRLINKHKDLTQFKEQQTKAHNGIVPPSACIPHSVSKEE